MTLTLYGAVRSRANRVMWVLEETGLKHEQVDILPSEAGSHDGLAAVNPFRRVPALTDGDVHLFESLAITIYLAKKAGGPFAPANLAEEGQILAWSFWAVSDCEPHTLAILLHRALLPVDRRDDMKAVAAEASLEAPLKVLEAHLAANDYLVGGRFTVADLNVGSVLNYMVAGRASMDAYPSISAWLKRINDRPAAKTVAAKRAAS